MELDVAEFGITEINSDINSMFAEIAKNKSVDFAILNNEKESGTLITDKQRLEQILRNLLSNAFKVYRKRRPCYTRYS